jgi:protein-S-isoprenylcysteine O-methyltransferase Ste14
MVFSPPQLLFIIFASIVFMHFMTFGSKTFVIIPQLDSGVGYGQASFMSGTIVTLYEGITQKIDPYRGVAAALIFLCSVMLYEWARRSVRGRGFSVGLSGRVPDSVFQEGPYAYVRHPFYLSYMLAFAASALALPQIPTLVVCIANLALFTYMAISDERTIEDSPLALDYATYKQSVGRFLPHFLINRPNASGPP